MTLLRKQLGMVILNACMTSVSYVLLVQIQWYYCLQHLLSFPFIDNAFYIWLKIPKKDKGWFIIMISQSIFDS